MSTIGVAYIYGKGETDRVLDRWREMHRKTFTRQAHKPHEH